MAASDIIEHEGVVLAVDAESGTAQVRVITGESGCGGCMAASLCHASKGEALHVNITGHKVRPGQRVSIAVSHTQHRLAVITTLVLPWLILVGLVLLFGSVLAWPQWLAVVLALAASLGSLPLLKIAFPSITGKVQFKIRNVIE